MDKKTILWIIIAILAVAVLYVVFKAGSSGTGQVVTSGKLDTTGWTENEKMNYEMHGTIPARVQQSGSNPTSSGMVGGC